MIHAPAHKLLPLERLTRTRQPLAQDVMFVKQVLKPSKSVRSQEAACFGLSAPHLLILLLC